MSRRAFSYRLVLCFLVGVPFLICQPFYPMISHNFWENASENLYLIIAQGKDFKKDSSSVVIIEADIETEKRYGWPINRSNYALALNNLKESGQPLLVSLLNFQKTADVDQDEKLADAITDYDRYIGSSMVEWKEGLPHMSEFQEDVIWPKVVLSNSPIESSDPDEEYTFDQADVFLKGETIQGLGPRYGTESTILCTPFYIQRTADNSPYAIPTSLLWAGSIFQGRNISTSRGMVSSYFSGSGEGILKVASKHCFADTSLSTKKFFSKRGVEIIPLYKFIEGKYNKSLKGKVAILAMSRMRKFQGPGANEAGGSGIVPEHYLGARFLDNFLNGDYISREKFADSDIAKYVVGIFSALFLIFAVGGRLNTLSLAIFISCLATALFSFYRFWFDNIYFVPISLFCQWTISLAGIIAYYFYLKFHGVRQTISLRDDLRSKLSATQDFSGFEAAVKSFFRENLSGSKVSIEPFYVNLYKASQGPHSVAEFLNNGEMLCILSRRPFSLVDQLPSKNVFLAMHYRKNKFNAFLNNKELGEVLLSIQFESWEKPLISNMLNDFRNEVSEQWARVHAVVEKKVEDYKTLVSNARTQILEKFLSEVIVNKFQDGRTMDENLSRVLTPRQTKASILQADIRGYSKLFKDQDSISIVKMLQGYYGRAVDVAQKFSQIKLIGDCIFLFIEEDNEQIHSSADLALYLASVLIEETKRENQRQKMTGRGDVVFGIALHFGDVIMGNLSSDDCIDYTVVGPHVNRTARMEELTKNQDIRAVLGPNGIIFSKEFENSLRTLKLKVNSRHMDLVEIGCRIRSFEEVDSVSYLTAEDVKLLPNIMYAGEKKAG